MSVRSLLFVILVLLIALFAAVNWTAFVTPTQLSLIFTSVTAPLGLVMLGLVALLTIVFLMFALYMQTTVLIEARRHAKEVHAQRELADQAEASRFTELRTYLANELHLLREQDAAAHAGVLARLDRLEIDVRNHVEQTGNSLSAYIGEFEDRVERRALPPTPAP
ncbi:MAG: hypothetical protein QM639_08355 [Rhodocyclaceae bacterium]